ncbi:hypothetical protein G6553_10460 [Nocardioides sp. IC4_145]|uniref:hypothetical protein n=1 Tax=Nocardioides sp. IC4_145 TaxID=2714037 RepID=UPI001408A5A4|nr:hypothetical protein [Nocardioides sp. IC4_145]NHC23590.1 hypothetical protein [Nocardioides sp. IC4_145]
MTGKRGDELGVELGRLWYAGTHDLPAVAEDYWTACTNVPSLVSAQCARGGGLGADPGASIDDYSSRIYQMLLGTRTSVALVGEALVWIADEYAKTDASCRASFESTKTEMEAVGDGS